MNCHGRLAAARRLGLTQVATPPLALRVGSRRELQSWIVQQVIDQRLSDSKLWQAVLYCGMTRAMVRPELLVQEGSGLQQRLAP